MKRHRVYTLQTIEKKVAHIELPTGVLRWLLLEDVRHWGYKVLYFDADQVDELIGMLRV